MPPASRPRLRAASSSAVPVVLATPRARPELRDPQPAPVHEPAGPAPARRPCSWTRAGSVVKAYRDRVDVAAIVKDAAGDRRATARAARAGRCPSPGRFTPRCRCATTCPTGGSCSTRASRPPRSSPSSARRRRTRARPTLYRLGTLLAKTRRDRARAGRVRARARAASPTSPRPTTIWARCWRRAAISRRRSRASARRSRRRRTIPTR